MEMIAKERYKTITSDFSSETGDSIIDYYTEAGPDYEYWSKNFNMHFGFADQTWDCLSREKMLQRMNERILGTLAIKKGNKVLDMGCGKGATVRFGSKHYPSVKFIGFTITPWQIKKADAIIKAAKLTDVEVKYGDYNKLPIKSGSIDAVYGLESICHAEETSKKGPLKEAYRILKKGGRFTMIDGFIKKPEKELSTLTYKMYRTVCENWALPSFPNINDVSSELKELGFKAVSIREISWKIAPSAVHAPFVSLFFLVKKLLKGEKLKRQNWNNLKACFTIFFLGLCRKSIGYYEITAKKD